MRTLPLLLALACCLGARAQDASARRTLLDAATRASDAPLQALTFLEALVDAPDFTAARGDLGWVADHAPKTGTQHEQQLIAWLPLADRVSKLGERLILEQAEAYAFDQAGSRLELAPRVELRAWRLDPQRVRLDVAAGVRVQRGILGPFGLRRVEVTRTAAGASAKLWVEGWPFAITLELTPRAAEGLARGLSRG
ncbi:MAG: hypothetical protein R3F62_29910 [Planctomycetota bacterium]